MASGASYGLSKLLNNNQLLIKFWNILAKCLSRLILMLVYILCVFFFLHLWVFSAQVNTCQGDINEDSALNIIIHQNSRLHLHLIDGIVYNLLAEKWKLACRFRYSWSCVLNISSPCGTCSFSAKNAENPCRHPLAFLPQEPPPPLTFDTQSG